MQYSLLCSVFVFMTFLSCTEQFNITNEGQEDYLVVNALLTDQNKNQKILLSRTIGFEESDAIFETDASVIVTENDNKTYFFDETADGVYESNENFAIVSGNIYQLYIKTKSGREYRSKKVIAPAATAIDNIYAKKMVNEDGVTGLGIFLNSYDPSNKSIYYRYEFEETYRILAPNWYDLDIVVNFNDGQIIFDTEFRPQSKQICYNTEKSKRIIVTSTAGSTEDRVQNYQVHFIPADDIRVENRYSILVKQYVQTSESQTFYKVLSNFSSSGNIFSPVQPGFIKGNIESLTDGGESVVGFFDVSTVSEKRIFLNREEYLEGLPRFTLLCKELTPKPSGLQSDQSFRESLAYFIQENEFIPYYITSRPNPSGYPIITFVPKECGDCSVFGTGDKPDFWID